MRRYDLLLCDADETLLDFLPFRLCFNGEDEALEGIGLAHVGLCRLVDVEGLSDGSILS